MDPSPRTNDLRLNPRRDAFWRTALGRLQIYTLNATAHFLSSFLLFFVLSLSHAPSARPHTVVMQDPGQENEMPLEERMRNLILKNSQMRVEHPEPSMSTTPAASAPPQDTGVQHPSKPPQKSGKKRPNQAQRRQMSSQFTIPIDPRSVEPQQGYAPSPASRQAHYGHTQRTQSAHFSFQTRDQFSGDRFSRGGLHALPPARHHPSPSYPGVVSLPGQHDWRQPNGAHNGFSGTHGGSGRPGQYGRPPTGQGRSLFNPHSYQARPEDLGAQVRLLEKLSADILANAEIELSQITEKEDFRLLIEDACRVAIVQHENTVNGRPDFPPLSVQLRCFGSLASGFATKSSDMDLGLLSPFSHPQPDAPGSPIPRVIEKFFLDMGLGARLLSKTRVPIIKVCQKPPSKLYSDLVEERGKWEKGGDKDHDAEDDDAVNGHPSSPMDSIIPGNKAIPDEKTGLRKSHQVDDALAPVIGDENNDEHADTLLQDLKQGTKSLPNYYGAAKKLLKKLSGRDITNSTAANFTLEEFRILNEVCLAFVDGLANARLRTRLQAYDSLSFDPASPTAPHRSIYGVMAQVEGEKTVMAWELRTIHERDAHLEDLARSRIDQWKHLQNKPNCGYDPLAYNKELQVASDNLKKIPSIALLLLEQTQFETASSYHNRVRKLLIDLGGHDNPSYASPLLSVTIQQYVRGIYDKDIRASVSEFLESAPLPSLRAVARRHKSLQLAREFERALEKGLYSEDSVEPINGYVNLLREPMAPSKDGDMHFDFVVPIPAEYRALVDKMRDLRDPARMSPNQPRDPYRDKLEFPKSDIGVQCDINFSAQLALQNTHLLRCYSLTDPRVRPLVLFVKHWAKVRDINTPYRGTLSSYGYVLMVMHYLINVTRPAVCPNLQLMAPQIEQPMSPEQIESTIECKGRDIRFWRDADEISNAAQQGRLAQNTDSIGLLIRGFFEYYAQNNMLSAGHMRGFDWGRDVISIRTHGGLLSKQEKGWTGAKTVLEVRPADVPSVDADMRHNQTGGATEGQANRQSGGTMGALVSPNPTPSAKTTHDRGKSEVKEIRHRFLFAIEDPFELDHNVARTVTHNGIVSIRDEFRRAWRIIKNAGKGQRQEDLLEDASQEKAGQSALSELIDEIHGKLSVP